MGDVANFRAALAEKNEDNTLWTPQDCVEAFLDDIKSGEIAPKRVLVIYEQETDNGVKISSYRANLDRCQEAYLISAATYQFQRDCLVVGDQ